MTARRLRRILCATDFSRASSRAFRHALELARAQGARLSVLHVMTPPSPFAAAKPPASWIELEARARARAGRLLAGLVAEARRAGVRVAGALEDGHPAATIARRARRDGADAIVLGTHGRSGLGRAFMGSVAAQVLQLAPCPVVTVRGSSRGR